MPNVKVEVRIRPCDEDVLDYTENRITVGAKTFTFDKIHSNVSQQELFNTSASHFVDTFISGENCSILSYGQTGSGKTYTMGASIHSDDAIIQRSLNKILSQGISLSCTFIEIYNDSVFDLLSNSRVPLSIRQMGSETSIVGLREQNIEDYSHAISMLHHGSLERTTRSTQMNMESSRSHAIYTLIYRRETDGRAIESRMSFVDLAGSERLKRTACTGNAARESISINSGLLALGNVINALYTKKNYIPYRDSKLTRILQKCLDAHVLLIACVSASQKDLYETADTLKYASRAAAITLSTKVHVESDKDKLVITNLRKEISLLKEENIRLKTRHSEDLVKSLREENAMLKSAVNLEMINNIIEENRRLKENSYNSIKDHPIVKELVDKIKEMRIEISGRGGSNTNSVNSLENSDKLGFQKNIECLKENRFDEKILDSKISTNNDILSYADLGLDYKIREFVDNSISRLELNGKSNDSNVERVDFNLDKNQVYSKANQMQSRGTTAKSDCKESSILNPVNRCNYTFNNMGHKPSSLYDKITNPVFKSSFAKSIENKANFKSSINSNENLKQFQRNSFVSFKNIQKDADGNEGKSGCRSVVNNTKLKLGSIESKSKSNENDSKIKPGSNKSKSKSIDFGGIPTGNHATINSLENANIIETETKASSKQKRAVSFDLKPRKSTFTPRKERNSLKIKCEKIISDVLAISMVLKDGLLVVNSLDGNIKEFGEKDRVIVADEAVRCMELNDNSELLYSTRSLLKQIGSESRAVPLYAYRSEITALKRLGNIIYTGHEDGTVCAMDLRNNSFLFNERIHSGTVFGIETVGEYIYTCSRDHTIKVLSGDSLYEQIRKVRIDRTSNPEIFLVKDAILDPPHYDTVCGLLSYSGSLISYSRDNSMKVWKNNAPFKTVSNAHDSWIKAGVSFDGFWATGCKSGTLRCWDFIESSVHCIGSTNFSSSINYMIGDMSDAWVACQSKEIYRCKFYS